MQNTRKKLHALLILDHAYTTL